MTIVPATRDLLATLAPKVSHNSLFTRYKLSAAQLTYNWTAALARGEGMRIASGPEGPVGLAWFTPHGAFGRGAYLRLLVVADAAQHQGLGRRLLAAYEDACTPSPGGWFLLCSDFNHAAQMLYQAEGYAQVGALPGFVLADVVELIYYKARAPLQ